MISTNEFKLNKVLSYITTYFSILFVMTIITVATIGFGALLGIVIFKFFKKIGDYSINIGKNFKNSDFDKNDFELNFNISKNYTLIQVLCYSITFIILISIEKAFTDGLLIILPIFMMIIFNLYHLRFLYKLKRMKI
jgi:hypothetical protein